MTEENKSKKVLVQATIEDRYKSILETKAAESSGGLAQQVRLAIIKFCEEK